MNNIWEDYKKTVGTVMSGMLAARLDKPVPKESLNAHVIAIMCQWDDQAKELKNLAAESQVTRAMVEYIRKNPEKFTPERRQFVDSFDRYEKALNLLLNEQPELVGFTRTPDGQIRSRTQHVNGVTKTPSSRIDFPSHNPTSLS